MMPSRVTGGTGVNGYMCRRMMLRSRRLRLKSYAAFFSAAFGCQKPWSGRPGSGMCQS